MKRSKVSPRRSTETTASHRVRGNGGVLLLALLCLAGCSTQPSSVQATPSNLPQSYVGLTANGSNLTLDTFAIDRTAQTFVQNAYKADDAYEEYVFTSGAFTTLPNGILNIGVKFGNGGLDPNESGGTIYNPPQTGNWAVEWPGQGGFAGLLGQTVSPFASNQTCSSATTSQTFQFVTFPKAGDSTDTAYGSVSINRAGGAVNFSSITQFNISGGASSNPSSATATGACGPTVYGQTISVPNTVTVTGASPIPTPTATIAIAPGGFLVEGNGYTTLISPPTYQNVLGAGLGAVGLPQPSSPLSTTAVVAAQYSAYLYSTGAVTKSGAVIVPPASLIGSFGYPNLQTACPTLPTTQPTTTMLYGGEFNNNDPSSNAYGNCDLAVDLGTQDPKNNGLYPHATVWIGSAFPRTLSSSGFRNQGNTAYSFSAVAVVSQLQSKYAIFLIGFDPVALQNVVTGTTQDWGFYLLQSN